MESGSSTPVFRMRIELDPSTLEPPRWPAGVDVRSFTLADAEPLHSLLAHAYRHGGGTVSDLATWTAQMTTDEEYDPTLWTLAQRQGLLIGAVLCWTSGFVKDVVVHEAWRGHGLGEALLRHALSTFAARGVHAVELKVHAANSPAIRLYKRVGMRIVERLHDR
jgi:ribosomal protein S18 acetylase RimI-like enzyme